VCFRNNYTVSLLFKQNLYLMKNMFTSWLFLCLLMAGLALPLLTGCHGSGEKAQEKSLEAAIESSSGEKAEVDIDGQNITIESDNYSAKINTQGDTWPSEIPDDVPEFTYGTIQGITTTDVEGAHGWGMNYRDVAAGAIEKYNSDLKQKGFKTVKVIMDEGGSVTGEKDNIIVSVISGDDMTHVSVQVAK